MKKLFLIFITHFFFINFCNASPITYVTAKKVAKNFFISKGKTGNISLAYTDIEDNDDINYYIFNFDSTNGFVIVCADDATYPILGYSLTDPFITNNLPPSFVHWMSGYKLQIENIRVNNLQPTTQIINSWTKYKSNQIIVEQNFSAVDTLVTKWNQDIYFNHLCPIVNNALPGYDGRCPTGCVATAMAQIMKYWNYPKQGCGDHTDAYGGYYRNFGGTVYDWSSMPIILTQYNDAVAGLMFDCGVSVNMIYAATGSGAHTLAADGSFSAEDAYKNYFGYNSSVHGIRRWIPPFTTEAAWIDTLKNELNNHRPIQYAGNNYFNTEGHSWVCDGYQDNYQNSGITYFHMNWGWGGADNAYFTINWLQPDDTDFSYTQEAIIGIQPSQADLTIMNQSVSNTNPSSGSSITAFCSEYNAGQLSVNSNVVKVYLSNSSTLDVSIAYDLGQISVSSVPAQGQSSILSIQVAVPSGIPSGQYYLFFWADGNQIINEGCDGNNYASIILNVSSTPLLTPHFEWAKQIGGPGSDLPESNSITRDNYDNIYTTGCFVGTVDFDPGIGVYNLIAPGNISGYDNDLFISKLDASGNFVWAKQIGGTQDNIGYSIATDAIGNVYVTGSFWGVTDFDPGPSTYNLSTYPSAVDRDIFVLKLDPSGNFIWAKQIGAPALDDYGYSIALDVAGNIYTTGSFKGTVDFDPGTGIYNLTAGYAAAFILKLNSSGNFVWAKKFGGGSSSNGIAKSIFVDASGNVYTTGYMYGSNIDFNPGAGTYYLSFTQGGTFISKLTSSGNFVWAQKLITDDPNSSGTEDHGYSITADAFGNVYTAGGFEGTTDFDPGSGTYYLTATNGNGFISKLDISGNFVWAKQIGSKSYQIVTDGSGNLFSIGQSSYYNDILDFDPGVGSTYVLISPGTFISKLDVSGNFVWAKKISNFGSWGSSLSLDPSGNIFATGEFHLTNDFDPGLSTYNLTSTGQVDVFVAKFSQQPQTCTPTFSTINAIGCLSYTLNGQTYTTSGAYIQKLPNAADCDSTITLNLTITCSTPTNITSSNITGTAATISWIGNSCAVKYRIQYRLQGTTTWTQKTVTPPIVTKTLTALLNNSTYEFQVRTECNSYGTVTSSYSPIQTFTTTCTCSKPTSITINNISQTTAKVNWVGNNCAFQYRLQYRKIGTQAWTTKIISIGTLYYNIIGLTSNSTYEYHLRSDCNSTGSVNSGWSTTQTFTTLLRLENINIDLVIPKFTVNPNPCSICEIIGDVNSDDLVVTDILGRIVATNFVKTSKGYSINFTNDATGFFIIRSKRTGQVVKFVRE